MRVGLVAVILLVGSSCSTVGEQADVPRQTSSPDQLAYALNEASAIAIIRNSVRQGQVEADAVGVLVRSGFACRPLSKEEYSPMSREHVKEWMCWIVADRTSEGYKLVYAGLSIDRQAQVIRASAGGYPVIYRNLRTDSQGRIIVVQDPSQWERP